jgi:hypothetical protein
MGILRVEVKNKIEVLQKPCKTRVSEFSERHPVIIERGWFYTTIEFSESVNFVNRHK